MASSAGAIALGGMLNMAPGLLSAAVLRAPFLDPVTAMLSPSLPLTTEEYGEWGDPATCDVTRRAMVGYSPYDGLVKHQAYPALLLVAAEKDSRVPFTQAIRYLARLRLYTAGLADGRVVRQLSDRHLH